MKIWIFNHYATPPDQQFTGPFDLAKNLVEMGHEVTMFAAGFSHYQFKELRLKPGQNWKIEEIAGVRFFFVRTFPYHRNDWRRVANVLSFSWRALWLARRETEKPDVIIGVTNHHFAALTGYLLSVLSHCPFIFELRDLCPLNLIEVNALSRHNPLAMCLSAIEKLLLVKSKKIISVLPFADEYVQSRGISSEKVVWIPSGVDLTRYKDLAPYDGEVSAPFTVMYLGGHVNMNALDVVLRAARIQQDASGQQVRFVFVGGGQEKPNLMRLAQRLELRNVEFRDPVSKLRLPEMMKEADAFILSLRDLSMYRYGNNLNKLHDYLAAGRPIIFATNARHNPVRIARAGLTVSPECPEQITAAICQLRAMTSADRLRMGQNAQRYAQEHLDIRVLAEKADQLLKQVLSTQDGLAKENL